MRGFFLILFSVLLSNVSAQTFIPHGSFDETDSLGNLKGWRITRGNVVQKTAFSIISIPFTATDGNYFLSMENDTVSLPLQPAMVSATFPFSDTPNTLVFDAFFLPGQTHQRYAIRLLLTKWNASKRDTVLFVNDTVAAVTEGSNQILVKWSEQRRDIRPGYLVKANPDTATLDIISDAVTPFWNKTLLLMDHIRFSSWITGNEEFDVTKEVSVFPNPATDKLSISIPGKDNCLLSLYDHLGKMVMQKPSQHGETTMDVSDLSPGLYFLFVHNGTESGSLMRKVIVSH